MNDVVTLLEDRIDVHQAKRNEASRNKLSAVQTMMHDEIVKELKGIKDKIEKETND